MTLFIFPYDGGIIGSYKESVLIDHAHSICAYGGAQGNINGGVLAGYNAAESSQEATTRYASYYRVINPINFSITKGAENCPPRLSVAVYISY